MVAGWIRNDRNTRRPLRTIGVSTVTVAVCLSGRLAKCVCVCVAQVVDGKEVGFHVFLVQLRDASHTPLSGVEIGEVGPKIGDNCTETGYLRLNSVRIPRDWMLMKNQQVTEGLYLHLLCITAPLFPPAIADGRYIRKAKAMESKAMYSTMLAIRAGLVAGAGLCCRTLQIISPLLPL